MSSGRDPARRRNTDYEERLQEKNYSSDWDLPILVSRKSSGEDAYMSKPVERVMQHITQFKK
jgi:hypothetical protein